jgi:POT family proton-dependent oligopeptide transporter
MTDVSQAIAERRDRAFIGHPVGLGWLSFAEFWERFSYYGMTALLVLYMTHQLLLPGHIEHVIGFAPFNRFVSGLYGSATGQPLASHIFGLYAGTVYLTPIFGGLLSDLFLGRTTSVIIGAISMAIGHFLMAFDQTFLFALLCLLVGVGFFKGNIASQVGALYKNDDPRRANAYQIFLLSVQIAVIGSPIICGWLATTYGWHYGFGCAGVGMLIGLTVYLLSRKTLPAEPPKLTSSDHTRDPLTGKDGIKFAVLIFLLPVLAVALCGNQEINNAYMNWAETHYQLTFGHITLPTPWLLSLDAIISALTIPAVVAFWQWWETKWAEPDEITKITIGVAIASLAPLMLVAASAIVASTHQKVGLGWALGFEIINDIGFANVFPVGLALYSRAAPKGLSGLVIGLFYIHLFMGNLFIGWLGGLLDSMPATSFWLLHVGFMAVAAAILLVVKFTLGWIIAPPYRELPHAAE